VHAKVFVSDDCKAVVGTINLDYRSFYLHFECAAYLRNVPAVADVEADFQATLALSQEITQEDLKRIPLLTRVAGWLLKVVAPVM
jgi:cardiolipin synthase